MYEHQIKSINLFEGSSVLIIWSQGSTVVSDPYVYPTYCFHNQTSSTFLSDEEIDGIRSQDWLVLDRAWCDIIDFSLIHVMIKTQRYRKRETRKKIRKQNKTEEMEKDGIQVNW